MRRAGAHTSARSRPWIMAAGFAAIYFVWGSTFLAIRIAVEEMPPFLMAGTRFVVAGAALYLWRRLVHGDRPEPRHWKGAVVVGSLLFMGCNGAVVWSEQRVPSGLTALMLALIPLWMVLLDACMRDGAPLNARVGIGVLLGLAGLALLLGPSRLLGASQVDPFGACVLIAGSFCWASGSLLSRRFAQPASPGLAAGMQMLLGGSVLMLAGLAAGEPARLAAGVVTARSILCLGYLIVFGSIVGFTAYTWLLTVTTPARISTYAFVNPVVAVLLGWAVAGEQVTARTLAASAVIVAAVATIILARVSPAASVGEPDAGVP